MRFLGERNGRDLLRERKRGELVTKSMGAEKTISRSFSGIFHCRVELRKVLLKNDKY